MYYTIEDKKYKFSKNFDYRALLGCLKFNFLKILHQKELNSTLIKFKSLQASNNSDLCIATYENKIVCFILGEFRDDAFISWIFCWNHMHSKFSAKLFRKISIIYFKELKAKGIKNFVMPLHKNRKKVKFFLNLIKKVFPESFPVAEDQEFVYLNINLE